MFIIAAKVVEWEALVDLDTSFERVRIVNAKIAYGGFSSPYSPRLHRPIKLS